MAHWQFSTTKCTKCSGGHRANTEAEITNGQQAKGRKMLLLRCDLVSGVFSQREPSVISTRPSSTWKNKGVVCYLLKLACKIAGRTSNGELTGSGDRFREVPGIYNKIPFYCRVA